MITLTDTIKYRPILFSAPMVRAIIDGRNPLVWVIVFKRVEGGAV